CYKQSVHMMIDPEASKEKRDNIRQQINSVWKDLYEEAYKEFKSEGHGEDTVICEPFAMMRYTGQLEDVEVPVPMLKLKSDDDLCRSEEHTSELQSRFDLVC